MLLDLNGTGRLPLDLLRPLSSGTSGPEHDEPFVGRDLTLLEATRILNANGTSLYRIDATQDPYESVYAENAHDLAQLKEAVFNRCVPVEADGIILLMDWGAARRHWIDWLNRKLGSK